MESWLKIKNALFDTAFETRSDVPSKSKNTLKTFQKVDSSKTITDVYQKTVSLRIPRNYDNLSQLYLKITLSSNLRAITVAPALASRIFKSIRLETRQGLTIADQSPVYAMRRYIENFLNGKFTAMSEGMDLDSTFAANLYPSLVIPLWFFFSEHEDYFLKTRSLEELQLTMVFNDSADLMGLSGSFDSAQIDLFGCWYDTPETDKVNDFIFTEKTPKYVLPNTYSIYRETPLTLAAGSTSAKVLLRGPNPFYALHAGLWNKTTHKYINIKRFVLTVKGTTLVDIDYRMNWEHLNDNSAYFEDSVFSYFFSKYRDRKFMSGLMMASQGMFPVYATFYFDALANESELFTEVEIRNKFEVDAKGFISEDLSVIDEYQRTNI